MSTSKSAGSGSITIKPPYACLFALTIFLNPAINCLGNESKFAVSIWAVSSLLAESELLDRFEYELKLNGFGRVLSICASSTARILLTGQCES
jgi:hypothetical protein